MAYLDDEPGANQVGELMRRAPNDARLFISLINLGEVVYNLERDQGMEKVRSALANIRRMPLAFVGIDENTVLAAAHVKANYRVSYADAFAIALAQELNATIVTGDPEFKTVEKIVDILWLTEPKRRTLRESRASYRLKSSRKKKTR